MSEKILKINSGGFEAALAKSIALSKRGSLEVIREAAKGVIKNVIRVTPPGRSTKSPITSAAKGARAKVAADILKVFAGVPAKGARVRDVDAMKPIHRRQRVEGQVVKPPSSKITVSKTVLAEYIKRQQGKIGRLAAGWKEAAQEFGVSLPAWVTKHSTPGFVKVVATSERFAMTATNRSPYAGGIRQLEGKIRHAVHAQAGAMRKRIAFMSENAWRRVGFKAGRAG